jgi:hypothetical protein
MFNPLDVIKSASDVVSGVMDRFWPKDMDAEKRASMALELEQSFNERERFLAQASRDIIVAEMQQGDRITKWARPSVIYFGLGILGMQHVILPFFVAFGVNLTITPLPDYFWDAWKLVASVWAGGRTLERVGKSNKVVELITGNKRPK